MWWRKYYPLLFSLAIAINLLELGSLTVFHWNGTAGITSVSTSTPFVQRVTKVAEPAASAGIDVGDLINQRELLAANGERNPVPGTPYTIVAHRGAETIQRSVDPRGVPIAWDQTIRLIAVAWVLVFAFAIVMRGAKTVENDYLALTLLLMAIQSASYRTVFPDARALTLLKEVFDPFVFIADVALAAYAMTFGRPIVAWRRVFFWSTCAAIGAITIFSAANDAGLTLAVGFDPSIGGWYWMHAFYVEVASGLQLLNLCAAMLYAVPEDRQRLTWIVLSYFPLLVGTTVGHFALDTGIWNVLHNVSFFFLPAGLTYAALARRLFDVGFVLNRATVFAGVSTIVVGAFVLLEWALGKWFEDVNHGANVAVNAALALGLGLSIRWIHRYVDMAVDTVFFRKRHENEQAIRRFAREVAFLTAPDVIAERTKQIVLTHTDALSAQVLLATDFDDNDPAVAAMRAWNEPIDLHKYDTAIAGEIAFPMLVHGTFIGALVCGAKINGESFAPDERESLQMLAHGVGLSLHGLRERSDDGHAVLRRLEQRLDCIAEILRAGHPSTSSG